MSDYYRGILQIYMVKMKGSDIFKYMYPHFEKGVISCRANLRDCYPYCFNDKDKLVNSDEYFQFVTKDSEEEYILFNYSCSDELIQYEIDMTDFEHLFEEFSFEKNKDLFRIHNYKGLSIPSPTNLIICVEYWSGWTDCGMEYDSDMYIDGILDANMNKQEIRT